MSGPVVGAGSAAGSNTDANPARPCGADILGDGTVGDLGSQGSLYMHFRTLAKVFEPEVEMGRGEKG